MEEKYLIVYLMTNCLLYKIRDNVRMIYIDWSADYTQLKLYLVVSTPSSPDDYALMEDAVALFVSYDENYKKDISIEVKYSLEPFQQIYDGKYIFFARHEQEKD